MMFETDQIDSRDVVFEAVGLKKHFDGGKVAALRGVDLQIREGEFVAVIGPSGCGKSTLLKLLGSLDKLSDGALTYRGKSIADLPDPAAYRSHEIGFIFQSFHLLPTFTAVENVQIPVGSEIVDKVSCQILESRPGKGDHSIYGRVLSWIDLKRLVPLRIQK